MNFLNDPNISHDLHLVLFDIRQNEQISMIYMWLYGDDEHDMQDLFQ
jgi:hypothetical protein